ncbi:hypothetical protein D4R51_00505 [bacterium]|nr:MAG: hypothetical protein D4R51_00505 [bacterium]
MYELSIIRQARILRKKGFTHREIVKELGVSLGSASLWTKGIRITAKQKFEISERARRSAFTLERREKLRQLSKINFAEYRYRRKYTEKHLLDKITNFHEKHGRIPLKREFNMYHEYQVRFGSWNNAIRLVGFAPNPQLFAYKFIAEDGHKCDSFTEKIIDDWLYKRGINHKRNVSYSGTKMTADFSLGSNIILEFFGLAGVQRQYDKIIERKRRICRNRNLRLIEIYPCDLFPKNQLSKLVKVK